jgi:hypothetical protein
VSRWLAYPAARSGSVTAGNPKVRFCDSRRMNGTHSSGAYATGNSTVSACSGRRSKTLSPFGRNGGGGISGTWSSSAFAILTATTGHQRAYAVNLFVSSLRSACAYRRGILRMAGDALLPEFDEIQTRDMRPSAHFSFGRYWSRCRAISQTPVRSFSAATCRASSRSAGVSRPLASRKSTRSRA